MYRSGHMVPNTYFLEPKWYVPKWTGTERDLPRADVWPLTATLTKRLNAAHHRWQGSALGISWKDRVTNEEVRVRTGQQNMDDILKRKKTPLAWPCDTNGSPCSAYLDRRCTGRFRGSREVQVLRVQTGGVQSTIIAKEGNHLGGSKGGSSKQIRIMLKCGSMHPIGCGLNQGHDQKVHTQFIVRVAIR